jgi:hypothetical protein
MIFRAVAILAETSREKIILKPMRLLIVGMQEGEKRQKGGINPKGFMQRPLKQDSKAGSSDYVLRNRVKITAKEENPGSRFH